MKAIDLTTIQSLDDLGNFLRPDPEEVLAHEQTTFMEDPVGENPENIEEDEDETSKPKDIKAYCEADEYLCQNPSCPYLERRSELEALHLYEINGETTIVICNYCYDQGYRFCLFTHEVIHMEALDPILEIPMTPINNETMYAQAQYHQNQLAPDLLQKIHDLDGYLKGIGIENPYPYHTILSVIES